MNYEKVKDEIYKNIGSFYIDDFKVCIERCMIDGSAGKLIFLISETLAFDCTEIKYYYAVYDVWASKALPEGSEEYKMAINNIPDACLLSFSGISPAEARLNEKKEEQFAEKFIQTFQFSTDYIDLLKKERDCANDETTFELLSYFIGDKKQYIKKEDNIQKGFDKETSGRNIESEADSFSFYGTDSDVQIQPEKPDVKNESSGILDARMFSNQPQEYEKEKNHNGIIIAASVIAGILGMAAAVIFIGAENVLQILNL